MDDPRDGIGPLKGPLEGLLVVDFSTNLPGPMCTQKLAWMGATVVKIEPPGGDPTRHTYGGNMYQLTNAGKLVATLNLKDEAERAMARHLCTTADIVVESFRPRVAERLGVGYEFVSNVNPQAVYCSLPGYASTTTKAHRPSHDLTVLAESGAIGLPGTWRERDDEAPSRPSLPVVDIAAAESAVQAILAALVARQRGYSPSHIEVPLSEPIKYWSAVRGTSVADDGGESIPPYLDPANDLYRCSDHQWIAVSAIEPKFWAELCEVMRLSDQWPGTDPGSWNWQRRQTHGLRLQEQIEAWMDDRERPAVLDLLGGRGIPVAPVLSPCEIFHDRSAHELSRTPPAYFDPSGTVLAAAPTTDAHLDIVRRIRSSGKDWKDELKRPSA